MNEQELFEYSRGVWKIGKAFREVEHFPFAFIIVNNIVKEIYKIESWSKAGTSLYIKRTIKKDQIKGRYEFNGQIADKHIRDKYIGKMVTRKRSFGSPIVPI